jgi:hypothetical protein
VIRSKKLLSKKGKTVLMVKPIDRRKRGMVDPDVESFDCILDAAHTAMLIFEEDGAKACERWLRERGLDRDSRLRAVFQAMATAIPVTKKRGAYIRPEIDLLDRMNDALGLGVKIPSEPVPELKTVQKNLFGRSGESEDEEAEDVAEDEDLEEEEDE